MNIPAEAKRASAACIRHFVAKAAQEKAWGARSLADADWMRRACFASIEWARDASAQSLHILARKSLEYARYRAHLIGERSTDWPIDRLARDEWRSLAKAPLLPR